MLTICSFFHFYVFLFLSHYLRYVCLRAYLNTLSRNITFPVHVSCGRDSSGDNAICYALLVLLMTACFSIMAMQSYATRIGYISNSLTRGLMSTISHLLLQMIKYFYYQKTHILCLYILLVLIFSFFLFNFFLSLFFLGRYDPSPGGAIGRSGAGLER